jgi:hypothetical protein
MTGEEKYLEFCRQHKKDHPPTGDIDEAKVILNTVKHYLISEYPANEHGQVDFVRAVGDSVVNHLEAAIAKRESLEAAAKEMVDALIEKEIPQWPEIEAARKRLQSVLGYDGPSDA